MKTRIVCLKKLPQVEILVLILFEMKRASRFKIKNEVILVWSFKKCLVVVRARKYCFWTSAKFQNK